MTERGRSVRRLSFDPFIVAIVAVVVLASSLPARGVFAEGLSILASAGIALLFFLHGARLPREAIAGALMHWRLHALVLATTFVVFPLLALACAAAFGAIWALPEPLLIGLVFLGCVPSTVQSSIAFTAIAGGSVAAAVSAAALSNLAGVILTPVLTALLVSIVPFGVGTRGPIAFAAFDPIDTIGKVALQLLLPFVLGQLAHPWLADKVRRHRHALGLVDRGAILIVVYVAFSAAVVRGLWQAVSFAELAMLCLIDLLLLALVLGLTTLASRLLRLAREDEIALVFCGSMKSLATGVPIASLLFPEALAGKVLLPLMLFHQLQLLVMALLARRLSKTEPGRAIATDGGAR